MLIDLDERDRIRECADSDIPIVHAHARSDENEDAVGGEL